MPVSSPIAADPSTPAPSAHAARTSRGPRRRTARSDVVKILICLALVIAGGLGSWLVQTDAGKLQVQGLTLPGPNGQKVAADLYKPVGADAGHRVPLVVVTPGFQRTKETQISYSLELARRGIATLVVDPYNQGESSSQTADQKEKSQSALIPAIEAVTETSSFDWVDQDRIGITGHSAGGSQVRRAAAHYGALEKKALAAAEQPDSPGGTAVTAAERRHAQSLNPVRAVYISGWLRGFDEKSFRNIHSDMGLAYARYDEGGYRNINGDADLRDAPEAIAFINSGLPKDQHVDSVQTDHAYASLEDRTYRIAINDRTIHPFQPLDPGAIGSMTTFFTTTLDHRTDLSPGNQIWWLKEVCNLISLVGALVMLLPLARLLVRIPGLTGAAQPVPAAPSRPAGADRWVFWGTFLVTAVVACISFIPMARAAQTVFPEAANSQNTWFFPARMINGVLLWSLLNGALGLILFFGTAWWRRRRRPDAAAARDSWGLPIGWGDLGRTLVVAFLLLAVFYSLLAAVYGLFHSDYRFLVVAARPLSARWLAVALLYIPLLFIFFFTNSLRVNGSMRFAGQRRWVGYLLAALANSVGLAAIFVIQYATFWATGTVFWTTDWLYVNMLQSVLPMMMILPLFNRAFFTITGRVWLGPIVTVAIFALMSLAGSVVYLPLPH